MEPPRRLSLPDGSSLSVAEVTTLHGFLSHEGWPLVARVMGAQILEDSGALAKWGTGPDETCFLRGRIDAFTVLREWFERVVPAAYDRMVQQPNATETP